jgi:hypothetical protein
MKTVTLTIFAVFIVTPAFAEDTRLCVSAFNGYSVACVSTPGPVPCNIDGRLKGIRVGSELFRRTMASFPGNRCAIAETNGQFIFDASGSIQKGN